MSGLQAAEFLNRASIQSVRKTLGDARIQKVALAFHLIYEIWRRCVHNTIR